MFNIVLYKNSAENNRVDKTDYMIEVGNASGNLREESSIVDLNIDFEYDGIPNFNYVYIPILKRYYYVNDLRSVANRLWSISLSVDVLMSYKDAIYECQAFINRNEYKENPNIIDGKRVIEQGFDVETVEIESTMFNGAGSFVLSGLNVKFILEG